MNIVLLGAPGAGKGEVSKYLISEYGYTHISTGNLLRENIKNETELGKIAKTFMDKGQLVTDDIVISMLKEHLTKIDSSNGIIFDGFPRTIAQAQTLDKIIKIDKVINVSVPHEVIIERLSSRRACPNCGETDSALTNKEGICKKCGTELVQRSDDTEQVIENRLKIYSEQTLPLVEYYSKDGKVVEIDNSGDRLETFAQLQKIMQ